MLSSGTTTASMWSEVCNALSYGDCARLCITGKGTGDSNDNGGNRSAVECTTDIRPDAFAGADRPGHARAGRSRGHAGETATAAWIRAGRNPRWVVDVPALIPGGRLLRQQRVLLELH